MPRRERPAVRQRDPAYSHIFEAQRPVLPNGMPPEVKIPGVAGNEEDDAPAMGNPTASEPSPFETSPSVLPVIETGQLDGTGDVMHTEAEDVAPPATTRQRARPTPRHPAPKAAAAPETAVHQETRRITIKAAVTQDHLDAIKPLVMKGLAQRDVIAVAGRRAMKRFDPVKEFVPLPQGNRIALKDGYISSKAIQADLLDELRRAHDPLRLRSDAAMVRGQFETLFWTILEEVIAEFRAQYEC